jgi:multiple sugar transport system ATP-binding protein
MNFLDFEGTIGRGATSLRLGEAEIAIPEQRDGAHGALVMGVRPEHVHLDGDAPYRGRVLATEYLGTTQIVTIRTAHGEIKLRTASSDPVATGQNVGLRFDARTVSVFDKAKGRALISAANEGVLSHG